MFGPGKDRQVRGHFLRKLDEHNISCALAEDDPDDTVGWKRCGDIGNWAASCVRKRTVSRQDDVDEDRSPIEIWAAACDAAKRQVETAHFESQGAAAIFEAQRLLSLARRLAGEIPERKDRQR